MAMSEGRVQGTAPGGSSANKEATLLEIAVSFELTMIESTI
jgi:hypothetical protein